MYYQAFIVIIVIDVLRSLGWGNYSSNWKRDEVIGDHG